MCSGAKNLRAYTNDTPKMAEPNMMAITPVPLMAPCCCHGWAMHTMPKLATTMPMSAKRVMDSCWRNNTALAAKVNIGIAALNTPAMPEGKSLAPWAYSQ